MINNVTKLNFSYCVNLTFSTVRTGVSLFSVIPLNKVDIAARFFEENALEKAIYLTAKDAKKVKRSLSLPKIRLTCSNLHLLLKNCKSQRRKLFCSECLFFKKEKEVEEAIEEFYFYT